MAQVAEAPGAQAALFDGVDALFLEESGTKEEGPVGKASSKKDFFHGYDRKNHRAWRSTGEEDYEWTSLFLMPFDFPDKTDEMLVHWPDGHVAAIADYLVIDHEERLRID